MKGFTSTHAFALAALAAGLTLLGLWATTEFEARDYQRRAAAVLERAAAGPAPAAESRAERTREQARTSGVIGRLSIPRLGISGMIAEGISERTLDRAIGHVPGTPLPGERGNFSLAGHRDTFFRRLERVRPGDRIRVTTPDGLFTYRVSGVRVVGPRSVEVLWNERHPTLTLVTCYPFTSIGPAPQRWVVQADQVAPDEPRAARSRSERPAGDS